MKTEKIVVGLVGMPGSGKSLVVEAAQRRGYSVVVMGDVVREETRNRGLEPSPQNIGKVMLELRRTNGEGIIAEKCIPKIEQQKNTRVMVDGLRSLHEADVFKKHFKKFSLVAVHASPDTRFKRLSWRKRSDDPHRWEVFRERDLRELTVGLGNAIAMAENMIVNENNKEEIEAKVSDVLRRVEEKWMK